MFLLQVLLVDELAQLLVAIPVEGVQLIGQKAICGGAHQGATHGNRALFAYRQEALKTSGRLAAATVFNQCAIHRQLVNPQVARLCTSVVQR